jgi:type IV secretion system protein VirB9
MTRLLLLAALLAAPALAPAAAKDPRIATRAYDPGQIVTVHGRPGIQSTIAFGDNEHIDNIAVGDSANWQVTPNKHASLVFVKPMQATARSNMTVVTDRRTYLFDLIASPGAPPVYMLRFSNPPAPLAPPKPVVAEAPPPAPAPQVAEKAPEPKPADLNFAWAPAGAKQLLPSRTFDDGKSTWLAWPRDSAMPAILAREPNGDEGPVNYRVEGDYVVVDGVPAQLVLRQGKLVATLTPAPRPAPAAAAPSDKTQTASVRP